MTLGEGTERIDQFDVKRTSIRHSLYPSRLLRLMGEKAPRRLYYRGRLELLDNTCIGVLASRKVPEERIGDIRRFVTGFATPTGRTFVSGWVSPAELEALNAVTAASASVAILMDCSVNVFRPEGLLYKRLKAGQLLIASHCQMSNMRRSRPAAFQRNRIVAALSHVLLAPCAPVGSGTLKLATEALEQGAVVITIDWPQNAELIRRGAAVCGNTKLPPR